MDLSNLYVGGILKVGGAVIFQAGTLNGESISPLAPVPTASAIHQHHARWEQPNTTATAETRVVFTCCGSSAKVVRVVVGAKVAATGDSVVTVDVKKNGTTILASVITLDDDTAAYALVAGSILPPGELTLGQSLEIVIAITPGTGTLPTGLFVDITVDEGAVI